MKHVAGVVFVAILCFSSVIFAQSSSTANSSGGQELSTHWRLEGRDIRIQKDDISSSERTRRDAYMARFLVDLRGIEASGSQMHIAVDDPYTVPEIPRLPRPGALWVIATSVKSLLLPVKLATSSTPDDVHVYSEMRFQVATIIHKPDSSRLTVGSTFDVDFPGGRVMLADGHIASTPLYPSNYDLLPGRQYLLLVSPLSATKTFVIFTCWEIRDGLLYPNGIIENMKTDKGVSKLAHMPVEDAIEAIRVSLASEASQKGAGR
jgi:hypothetical protein